MGTKHYHPSISIGFVTDGKRPEKLLLAIQSVLNLGVLDSEILIAGTTKLAFHSDVKILDMPKEANKGLLGAMRNKLLREASKDIIIIVDDDVVFRRDFYQGLISYGPDFDVLSCRFLNPDGSRFWDWSRHSQFDHRMIEYEKTDPEVYITGGLCIINGSVKDSLSWNPDLPIGEAEDVDFSNSIKKQGLRLEFNQHSSVMHNDARYIQLTDYTQKLYDIEDITLHNPVTIERRLFQNKALTHDLPPRVQLYVLNSTDTAKKMLSVVVEFNSSAYPEVLRLTAEVWLGKNKLRELSFNKGNNFSKGFAIPANFLDDDVSLDIVAIGLPSRFAESRTDNDAPSPLKFKSVVFNPQSSEPVSLPPATDLSQQGIKIPREGIFFFRLPFTTNSPYARWGRELLDELDVPASVSSTDYSEQFFSQMVHDSVIRATWGPRVFRLPAEERLYLDFFSLWQIPSRNLLLERQRRASDRGSKYVAWLSFLPGALSAGWIEALAGLDEIWTTSMKFHSYLENQGIDSAKLRVRQPLVKPISGNIPSIPSHQQAEPRIVLAFVSPTLDSGWDIILTSYLLLMSKREDRIRLVLRVDTSGTGTRQFLAALNAVVDSAKLDQTKLDVQVLDNATSQIVENDLFDRATLLLHLPRYSDFPYWFLKALSRGLPVVTLSDGAHMEFCSQSGVRLVSSTPKKLVLADKPAKDEHAISLELREASVPEVVSTIEASLKDCPQSGRYAPKTAGRTISDIVVDIKNSLGFSRPG